MESFQKDALDWTDLGWPGAPAGFCGGPVWPLNLVLNLLLTSFPGWAAQFSQAMWPVSEEGGEVVPAPEEHGPAQPVQEVQRGLVSRTSSHELRFSWELSSTDSSLPPPALHPCAEIPAPCLPSMPPQRDPSSLHRKHLGSPWPTWLYYYSLLLLCYRNISCFSPLFAIQISFCCCTFILYWALVSDLSWLCHTGILLWHTFEPEKLSAVYILVLCWCFSSYYKGILSVAFPIVSLSA